MKSSHAALVFAIVAAPDGYIPTHNQEFAHAPTGDAEADLVRSRSKRLFNDRTGIRCGSHTEDMLLQTYRRDTGEIMHDLCSSLCEWPAMGWLPAWIPSGQSLIVRAGSQRQGLC